MNRRSAGTQIRMEDFILSHGSYLAIVLLLVLTGAGLPVPEEIVIVAAGVLSSPSVGRLDPTLAVSACLAGVLIGDCTMYWIGRGLGRTYVLQHRWFAWIVHGNREERLEEVVQKHGLKVFLMARFLVGIRSPLYLAMGILRVDFRRYLLCDAAGGAFVVGVFFCLSYYCGGWVGKLIRSSQWAATGTALIVAAVAAGYYIIWRKCRRQLRLDQPLPGEVRDDSTIP
jgi:membrane protein DedA with SNARE-associated domain